MKIYPLYSSSSGNMFCLETENSNILIDCGVSYKAACEGLKSINKSIDDITSIIITHEHSDHIKGLPLLIKKNDIPIYTCDKTAEFIRQLLIKNKTSSEKLKNIFEVDYNMPFKINDLEITPFEISHDAVKPCGYMISDEKKILTFATDLGYVSDQNYEYMQQADFLVLESNYDTAMLNYGPYPYPLKQRIASSLGHLSNDMTANTVSNLVEKQGKSNFLFAHLSQNNNMKDIAQQTIEAKLKLNDINADDINLNFASKTLSCEAYQI